MLHFGRVAQRASFLRQSIAPQQERGLHRMQMPRIRNTGSRHSTEWIRRQITDRYVRRAHEDNYRSRAAYKLEQLDDKFLLLRKNTVVVDLGCYPGGWSQVAVDRCRVGSSASRVVGVDRVRIDPLPDHSFVLGDVANPETLSQVLTELGDKKADVVLCDMAPNCTGIKQDDHLASAELCLYAANFMEEVLAIGGAFVTKIFMGSQLQNFKLYLQTRFKTVKSAKPKACRRESREMYLVAIDFRGRPPLASEVQVGGGFSTIEGYR